MLAKILFSLQIPQAIATATSPINVEEIVLNPSIRAVSNNNLATCSYCMIGQGQNLRQQLNIPGPPTLEKDCRVFVVQNLLLQMIKYKLKLPHESFRVAFLLTIIYIYEYKDHLGNTRVSFTKNSAGVLEVTDTNNYYPFGLNHIGNSFLSSLGSYNAYKYNGKEVQETGMYDYGARMYMPDLGRWGVVDAYAESMRRYSPYNYAFNNPVNYIDPDGNAPYNPRDVYGEHSAFNGDFDPNTSLSSYNGMGGSHGYGMYFESNPGAGYVWGANTNDSNDKYSLLNDLRSMWEARGIYTSIMIQ